MRNILGIYILITILLLGLAGLYIIHFAHQPKIAFVKSAQLMSGYQGMIDASQIYRKKSRIWQANLDTLNKEYQREKLKYEREQAGMSEKGKALQLELMQTKQQQMAQYKEGIAQRAQQEDQEMTRKVLEEINTFISAYAKEHRYRIIFGATEMGNIVYAEEATDLTDEILLALNQSYASN